MLEAKEELSDLQKSARETALKLQNEERIFEELSSQHMKALAEAQAIAAKLQSRRRERTKLNSEIERTKDVLSSGVYPRPVEYLMAAKRLGRLKVDFDPFVDAISCPKEYIPALQSFLGGRQFWILVPDEHAAGECIEYLKVGNAGRATFLPLNRANPQRKSGHPRRRKEDDRMVYRSHLLRPQMGKLRDAPFGQPTFGERLR